MKSSLLRLAVAFSLILISVPTTAQLLYWDNNGSNAGTGSTPAGTWGTDNFWNADSAGTGSTTAWTSGSTAVFAAGTNATNAYTVVLNGTQTAAGINFEEGNVTFTNGNLTLTSVAAIDVASFSEATISSIVAGGAIVLSKTGAGTLTLRANNTFSGGVRVGGGVVSFNGETSSTAGSANPLGALPAIATPGYLTLTNGGTLRCVRTGNANGTVSFANSARGISLGDGGGVLEVTDPATNRSVVYGGTIAGSGSLTKKGPGTLYLTGNSTYTGNTTNNAGTIRFGSTTGLGSANSRLVLAGGNLLVTNLSYRFTRPVTMTADTTVFGATTTANTFQFFNFASSSIETLGGTLTIRNLSSVGDTAQFQARFTNGGFNFSQPIVIGRAGENAAQLDWLTDIPVADQTFSGVISGPGGVRRTCGGDGTGGRTIVTGANTYSGGTAINGGHIGVGIDSVGSPVASGALGTGTITIGIDANAGFFAVGGPRLLGNDIIFGTGEKFTVSGSNALTFYGKLNLNNAPKTLVISNSALTTITGEILGTASGQALIKSGPGTLALNGANTFSGDTSVSAGQLLVNSTLGNVTVDSGAILGGTGTNTGSILVFGALAPGADGVGKFTGENSVNLGTDGRFDWQLGALKDDSDGMAGVDFDQFSLMGGTLTAGGSSKITIDFANPALAPDFAQPFWQTVRKWTIIKLSGSATNPNADNFVTIQTNVFSYAGNFSTAVELDGSISLTFTPAGPTAPIIVSQPQNQTATQNSNVTFSVSATGSTPLNYKWFFNNAPVAGGTSADLTISNVQSANEGSYFVIATNNFGGATSVVAMLTILTPPTITNQPQSQEVEVGADATFSVAASGTQPLSYQWRFNGTNIDGATFSSYTLSGVQTNDAGNYSVVVTNVAGVAASSDAVLTVNATPAEAPTLSVSLSDEIVTLSWNSAIGRSYRPQLKTDLNLTNWTDIPPDITATNSISAITNSVSGESQQYYRVLLLP